MKIYAFNVIQTTLEHITVDLYMQIHANTYHAQNNALACL
jgi:hypothetical protein